MTNQRISKFILLSLAAIILSGCVSSAGNRLAMVRNEETGLMYGSQVSGSLLTDPAFFPNKKLKLTIRNTTGDDAFKMREFRDQIEGAYLDKGYDITDDSDFGLKVDVNVVFSGQLQSDRMEEYAGIGLVGGSLMGNRSKAHDGQNLWTAAGAGMGAILGANDKEDTYIIVTKVTVGIRDRKRQRRKVITFSRSEKIRDYDDDESFGKWRETATIGVAVYAGGRNTPQDKISAEVRRRISNIVGDII
jgi:uncharacterized protein YcfJ